MPGRVRGWRGRPGCRRRRGHHLALAGRSDTLFSDDALVVIHQASRGLPRAINNLALQSLVATFASNKSIVDQSAAKLAVVEVVGD